MSWRYVISGSTIILAPCNQRQWYPLGGLNFCRSYDGLEPTGCGPHSNQKNFFPFSGPVTQQVKYIVYLSLLCLVSGVTKHPVLETIYNILIEVDIDSIFKIKHLYIIFHVFYVIAILLMLLLQRLNLSLIYITKQFGFPLFITGLSCSYHLFHPCQCYDKYTY